jgi:hypothetical protein
MLSCTCGKEVAVRCVVSRCGDVHSLESNVKPLVLEPDLLRTIEGEFDEMPGMRLTEAQFRRLWALEPTECQYVTMTLVNKGVLTRDIGGRYCRHADFCD